MLRNPLFRRTWLASLSSNLGIHILVATFAWSMMELTHDPRRVAMVQTTFLLPVLLFGFVSGSVVDTFEKRRIALIAGVVMVGAGLCAWSGEWLGLLQPLLILGLCFFLGSSQAFMLPAWQTNLRRLLPVQQFPQAITLNSISFNLGRSVGPAIGGILIAAVGTGAGFAVPVFAVLPLVLVAATWPREEAGECYRERLTDAVDSGVRYILNSPVILNCQFRALMVSSCTSVMAALAPFVATDLLQAGPSAYGGLLGAYGAGSVAGAMLVDHVRKRFAAETTLRTLLVIGGTGCAIVSFSSVPALSIAGYALVGLAHMGSITSLNIIGQLHSAQWAAARVFSSFFSFSAGGMAGASAFWGFLAAQTGTATAMHVATGGFGLMMVLGFLAPVAFPAGRSSEPVDPLPLRWPLETLSPGDGPILVELRFTIDEDDRRAFLEAAAELARNHARIGFRNWTLTRGVGYPGDWRVSYTVKTWADYLNHRTRMTSSDRETIEAMRELHRGPVPVPASISLVVRPDAQLARGEGTSTQSDKRRRV